MNTRAEVLQTFALFFWKIKTQISHSEIIWPLKTGVLPLMKSNSTTLEMMLIKSQKMGFHQQHEGKKNSSNWMVKHYNLWFLQKTDLQCYYLEKRAAYFHSLKDDGLFFFLPEIAYSSLNLTNWCVLNSTWSSIHGSADSKILIVKLLAKC